MTMNFEYITTQEVLPFIYDVCEVFLNKKTAVAIA